MKSASQQSWRSRLCTADIPLHSTLCPNNAVIVDKENIVASSNSSSSAVEKKPAASLGGWRDAGREGRAGPTSTTTNATGLNKDAYSSASKKPDIIIKEGFLNYYQATTSATVSIPPGLSPDRGGGGRSTLVSDGEMNRHEQSGDGKWVQVFMSLTGSSLNIFPSRALADTRSAVPGSEASKPTVINITPSTLIAAFSDHFEPAAIDPAPSSSSATTISKKSVSPDPVAPHEMVASSSRGGTISPSSGAHSTTQFHGKQQVKASSSVKKKSSWGRTLVGLHIEGTTPVSTHSCTPTSQIVFLSAGEEGLLTQWLKVIQQWCAPTHYNGRTPAVNNNLKFPKWLPFTSMLPTLSSKGGVGSVVDDYRYADLIPAPVWDLVLPLHPHHAFVTQPTTTTTGHGSSNPQHHRSPLATLTTRIANKKASSSSASTKHSSSSKSLSREKSKEPSAPPIRKKLIALKQATLKMNERLSSRMASRTSSAVNSLRCSTIHQKSDAGDTDDDDMVASSTCSVVTAGGGGNTQKGVKPSSKLLDPEEEDELVETRDMGVSCNLGELAASTASSALQSKLAALSSQNVSLETMNAKLSGKVIELENRVDVTEFERDSWMDKYHELLALTKKNTPLE